jgi:hypothetical protein
MSKATQWPTCDEPGCLGHVGKFDSCLSAAVWTNSLDGSDEGTGSVDFRGHLSLCLYPKAADATLDDGRTVPIPAGYYTVWESSTGQVYLTGYETEEAAREEFAAADREYGEWLAESGA